MVCMSAGSVRKSKVSILQAVADRHTHVKWVKVKGHSEHEGNDKADECATWAQNGGAKNERDINSIMAYLREHG